MVKLRDLIVNAMTDEEKAKVKPRSAEAMSDDELDLYVQRLKMRHKRLSRKWWGLRRKHGKDECPYCGMTTGGGFCKIHQRDYDEYLGALSTRQNRSFGL